MSSDPDTSAGLETIVVATDFSETADLAVRHGVALAKRHAAKLILNGPLKRPRHCRHRVAALLSPSAAGRARATTGSERS